MYIWRSVAWVGIKHWTRLPFTARRNWVVRECCAIDIAHWPTYYPWITPHPGTFDSMQPSGWKTAALKAGVGTAPELYELHESCMKREKERQRTEQWLRVNRERIEEWNECNREGKGGEGWRREIRLLCILLAIHTRTFHLRSHQLSNWESDGDVRASRISTRPELGAPLRPNQNTITFTARTDAHRPAPIYSFSLLTVIPKQTPSHSFPHKKHV